jgi:hypothetical protein
MSVNLSIAFTDGDPSLYVADLSDDVEGKDKIRPTYSLHHESINDPKVKARMFN